MTGIIYPARGNYSNFLEDACFGNRACQRRRDARIAAEKAEAEERARQLQIKNDALADENARRAALAQAEADKLRIMNESLEANNRAKDLELKLRELQKKTEIQTQAQLGGAAVDRANILNEGERDRLALQTNTTEIDKRRRTLLIAGGGVGLLIFIIALVLIVK